MLRSSLLLAVTILFLFTGTRARGEAPATDLVLEITTTLGVEKTVTVAAMSVDRRNNELRQKVILQHGGRKDLAIDLGGGAFLFVPWGVVKEVQLDKKKQIVTLADGIKLSGTLITDVTNKDDDRVYCLGSCSTIIVKKAPLHEAVKVGARKTWSVKVNDLETMLDGHTQNSSTMSAPHASPIFFRLAIGLDSESARKW